MRLRILWVLDWRDTPQGSINTHTTTTLVFNISNLHPGHTYTFRTWFKADYGNSCRWKSYPTGALVETRSGGSPWTQHHLVLTRNNTETSGGNTSYAMPTPGGVIAPRTAIPGMNKNCSNTGDNGASSDLSRDYTFVANATTAEVRYTFYRPHRPCNQYRQSVWSGQIQQCNGGGVGWQTNFMASDDMGITQPQFVSCVTT
ncbi:MAG: hypothetical protein ACK5LN_02835 [Propioniciclava sp.]